MGARSEIHAAVHFTCSHQSNHEHLCSVIRLMVTYLCRIM